jgi:excisionase family DNA binding protein
VNLSEIITRTKDLVGEKEAAELFSVVLETLQANRSNCNDIVGEKEAAAILGVTTGTLQVWRSTGRYAIPFIKVGRLVKYRRSVLEEWLDSRTRLSGATE